MSISWESNVRKVIPYTPGEQPKNTDVIKLNTNENPYPPSPRVKSILNEYDCRKNETLSRSGFNRSC